MVVGAVLHAVAPEPEQGPFRQKRAQLLVVKGALEERRMGHGLKCAARQATVVHVAQLLEQELGLGRLVPRGVRLLRSTGTGVGLKLSVPVQASVVFCCRKMSCSATKEGCCSS